MTEENKEMSKELKIKDIFGFLEKNGVAFLILGVVSLAAAGVWYAIGKKLDTWTQWLIIVGLGLIGIYVLLRPQDIKAAFTGRVVRYGSNALVLSIAAIGIVVLLNYLSNRYYKRFDMTEMKEHSLSEQSINILKEIDADTLNPDRIEVIGFYPNGSNQEEFEKWLDEYRAYTDKIDYQTIDPILEPGKAEQYAWSGYNGGLIIKRGSRQQQVYTADEQDITSALLKLSRETQKTVYFMTGHQERSPSDFEEAGYGQIADLLKQNNYQVGTLNLAITSTVPADAAMIIIAGPKTPLLEEEKSLLTGYLLNGGKAFVLVDPGVQTNINDVLASWYVRFDDSLVVDARNALGGDPTAPVIDSYFYSQVTKNLPMVVLPLARPLVQEKVDEAITWTPLAQTSTQSWAKPGISDTTSLEYVPGADTPGPLTLAGMIETDSILTSTIKTRLVLIGDVDFVANQVLSQIPNGQFLFLNAVNWLAEEEALIAIGPKTNTQHSIYLSTVQQGAVCFGSLIFIPAVILVVGVVVWLKRR